MEEGMQALDLGQLNLNMLTSPFIPPTPAGAIPSPLITTQAGY